ncbi:MAG: hypothetical protein OEZ59_06065 [Deltaproteobacteria bacterium]|nr:hypothetical protein [Deltaproteobacteria bacterium]
MRKISMLLIRLLIFGVCFMAAPVLHVAFAQQEQPEALSDSGERQPGAEALAEVIPNPPGPFLETRSPAIYPETSPTRVQIAILSGLNNQELANSLAMMISDLNKKSLEKRIGLKVELVNVSRLKNPPSGSNVIYYRPPFMRAAMLLAEVVPGQQSLRQMVPEMIKKKGVDVEVWVAN